MSAFRPQFKFAFEDVATHFRRIIFGSFDGRSIAESLFKFDGPHFVIGLACYG